MPGGGRGYTRPPTLISIWSTAPFLLNNSVGPFEQDPSVDARMRVFNASIEQLLWPEKRARDKVLGDKVPGVIDRTIARSEIRIPAGFVPDLLRPASGPLHLLAAAALRRERRHHDRPDPGRGAGQSAVEPAADLGIEQSDRTAAACRAVARPPDPAQARSAVAAGNARPTRSCARNSPICGSRCWS